MAEVKNVPKLRFPGFTEAWEQRKFPEFVSFFNGLTYRPSDVEETGTLVLRSSNVKNGEIVDADNVYVNSKVVTSENVQKGDIIIVVRNGSRALIGKHAQIKAFMPNTVIGAFMSGIRSEHSSFVNALLDTSTFENEIAKNMGATINQITGYMFSKMEFTIPSEEEQKKIGTFFENLDNLITLHQRKYETLLEYKKGLLQKMFPKAGETVPEIRFPGFDGEWEEKKLGELGNFKSNGVDKKINENEQQVNLLNYMDIYNKKKITNNNSNELMQVTAKPKQIIENNVLKGDVFLTPTSETPDDIGRVHVIDEDLENTVYSYHLIRFRPFTNTLYLYFPNYVLDTDLVRRQMEYLAQGVQRYVLSIGNFENIKIFVPSLEEQQKIGLFFKALDEKIELQKQKVDAIKKYKKGLLQQMFI